MSLHKQVVFLLLSTFLFSACTPSLANPYPTYDPFAPMNGTAVVSPPIQPGIVIVATKTPTGPTPTRAPISVALPARVSNSSYIAIMRSEYRAVQPSVGGQRFPPIGDLYSMQGGILLEENRLAEPEQALAQGLSLIHLSREKHARLRCYSALTRLRLAQYNWEGVLENTKELEESWPQAALYAQALRHRLSTREPYANQKRLEAARSWVAQIGRFEDLPDFASVDPSSEFYFRARLNVAHLLVRLASRNPREFSLRDVHNQLDRHERLAKEFGL